MNTLRPKKTAPTVAIPMVDGTRLQLAELVRCGESYYTMAMQLPALADEAAKLPQYLISQFAEKRVTATGGGISLEDVGQDKKYKTRTEKYLRTAMDTDWRNFVTFLSIPRPMLESIILGTVAWDYDAERGTDRGFYKQAQRFGIYVIGLAVQGRKGAWLTANEIMKLVTNVDRYLEAYDMWAEDEEWPKSGAGQRLKDFVAKVDNQLGLHKTGGPRFLKTADGKEAMEDLAKGLRKRADLSLELDPAGNVPMIQTPLYVGMSIDLSKRLPKHDPTKGVNSVLTSSNKAFAFVVSLMKFQGQEPLPKSVCVLRVWEKRDLYFAETLVSALAHSMICHDGFNKTECGDVGLSSGMKYDEDGEEYVKYRSRFFYDNCKAVIEDLRARKSHLDDLAKLQPALDGQMVSSTEQTLEAFKMLEKEMEELDVHMERLAEEEEFERANEDIVKELEIIDLINGWAL